MARADGALARRDEPHRGGRLWHPGRFGEEPRRRRELPDLRGEVQRMREVARLLQGRVYNVYSGFLITS